MSGSQSSKRLNRRWLWFAGAVVLVLVGLTIFAPNTTLQEGSTYSRAPSGYGAWYASLQTQGISVQRWQKPQDAIAQTAKEPITFIRISPRFEMGLPDPNWIRSGNVAVILGVQVPVSRAPFQSRLNSEVGAVTIDTSRRLADEPPIQNTLDTPPEPLLQDEFGAVVWQGKLGKGRVVYAAAPYLAANAYQDEPGNFKFLTQLVTEAGYPVWVDEFIHGYKDPETIAAETNQNVFVYLARTPLLLLGVQAIVFLALALWNGNRRLGRPIALSQPTVENSQAYIEALAAVLHKANSSEFVFETIRRAEQQHIQQALGLGSTLLDPQAVLRVWEQQGHSVGELAAVLDAGSREQGTGNREQGIENREQGTDERLSERRLAERDLLIWLGKVQTLRDRLPQR